MKNKLFILGLFLPVIFLLSFFILQNYQANMGYEVKVPVKGFDPRDLLSGHYVLLQTDKENIDCQQFENNICPDNNYFQKTYRYYVNEKQAQTLENLIRNNQTKAEIVFKIIPNKAPKVKSLLINGEEWENIKHTSGR